jgi:hypothetical protein
LCFACAKHKQEELNEEGEKEEVKEKGAEEEEEVLAKSGLLQLF